MPVRSVDERRKIEQEEGRRAFVRIAELEARPVQGNFDAAHLREIHRRIFQGLPHHAPGEYRPQAPAHIKRRSLEELSYRYYVHYAHRSQVDAGVEKVLSGLGGPDALRGLNAEQFSARMAKLYGDLDYLHPFREGNSRTLRTFTRQLALEAGLKLDWNATNADAVSRRRLYVARDVEVIRRAFPGLDKERSENTQDPIEFAAWVSVLEPFAKAKTLQTLVKESTYQAKDLAAAKSFREESPQDVLKKHPDLAGSFAKLAAIEHKTQADDLDGQQRSFVLARVRETLASNIERGQRPEQVIRQEQQVQERDIDRG